MNLAKSRGRVRLPSSCKALAAENHVPPYWSRQSVFLSVARTSPLREIRAVNHLNTSITLMRAFVLNNGPA
jgi:hypothetical protein